MIPLSLPNIAGNEAKYVQECLETGWISTAGDYVTKFEENFSNWIRSDSAVSTMNGTAALHLSMLVAGIKQDDLVVMPNVTFVASANAIRYVGAEPVLIDIDVDSWQMDLNLLESFLHHECYFGTDGSLYHKDKKKKVAAVLIVHVQGHMCDFDKLQEICSRFSLPLIEDAAEALGSSYDGKYAGTLGMIGCYSFNGNKIMSTGGGGMVISKNSELISKIRHLATTAKTNPMTYFHDEVGYNYRMVNILAAIGVAQLENLDSFINRKKEIASFYEKELDGIGDIVFQKSHHKVKPNNWLFTISTSRMKDLLVHLNSQNIMSRPFWMPMNQLPMYKECIFCNENDISNIVHSHCLSIPCSTNITSDELEIVVQSIKDFF